MSTSAKTRRISSLVIAIALATSTLVMTPGFGIQTAYAVGEQIPNGLKTCPDGSTLTYDIDPTQSFCQQILMPGTTSWTVPTGVTQADFLIVGAGGGGGGASYVSIGPSNAYPNCETPDYNYFDCQTAGAGGGGGGAGEVKFQINQSLTPGQVLAVHPGVRGAAGTSPVRSQNASTVVDLGAGTNGGNGEATTVTIGGSTITALGGGGGQANGGAAPASSSTVWGGGGGAAGGPQGHAATNGGAGTGFAGGNGVTGLASDSWSWNGNTTVTTTGLFNAAGGGGGATSAGGNGTENSSVNHQYVGGTGGEGIHISNVSSDTSGLFATFDKWMAGGGGGGSTGVIWNSGRGNAGSGSAGNGAFTLYSTYTYRWNEGVAGPGEEYGNDSWANGRLEFLRPGSGGGGGSPMWPAGAVGANGAVYIRFAATEGVCDTSKFAGGNGTQNEPFEVNNEDALNEIRNCIDLGAFGKTDTYFDQTSDITLTEPFTPISASGGVDQYGNLVDVPFRGIYNGQGWAIKNITITNGSNSATGIFGHIAGSRIMMLDLVQGTGDGIQVSTSTAGTGALVGVAEQGLDGNDSGRESRIEDVRSDVDILETDYETTPNVDNVGGIVGILNQSIIRDSTATGDITGGRYQIGGAVGDMEIRWFNDPALDSLGAYVENVHATGNISATDTNSSNVGGLIGYVSGNSQSYTYIVDSSATGSVAGERSVGGFVGNLDGNFTIRNSSATGSVTGSSEQIGGFAGYFCDNYEDYECTIISSFATGDVTSHGGTVGGFIGDQEGGKLIQVRASGLVDADSNYDAGGLVGYHYDGLIIESMATGDVVNVYGSGGGLVGYFCDDNWYCGIYSSEATGDVYASESNDYAFGGLVGFGYYGEIVSSIATGFVDLETLNWASNFVGYNEGVYINENNVAPIVPGDSYDSYEWTGMNYDEMHIEKSYTNYGEYFANYTGLIGRTWGMPWDIGVGYNPVTYDDYGTPNFDDGDHIWNQCAQFNDGLPFPNAAFTENPCLAKNTLDTDNVTEGLNGSVRAISDAGNGNVYVGGDFSRYGFHTGGGAVVVPSGDGPQVNETFPGFTGIATAVVSDGNGGFYVAGLTPIDAGDSPVAESNLVHILSDGSLDTDFYAWSDNVVNAMQLIGSHLYIGGGFSYIDDANGTQYSDYFTRLNAANGRVDTDFYVPVDGWVNTLTEYNGTLLISGGFDNFNGEPRHGIAQWGYEVGTLAWNPQLTSLDGPQTAIYTIKNIEGLVYVGGTFSCVGDVDGSNCLGYTRNALAVFAPDGSSIAGLSSVPTDMDYQVGIEGGTPEVHAIEPMLQGLGQTGDRVIAFGGYFDSFWGSTSLTGLALLDIDSNNLIGAGSVNLGLSNNQTPTVNALSYIPNEGLWAGGYFDYVQDDNTTLPLTNLAKLSTSSDQWLLWQSANNGTNYGADSAVELMAPGAQDTLGGVFVGGEMETSGGYRLGNLAKLDDTGGLLAWDAVADGPVNALLMKDNGSVYVGGDFSFVNGEWTGGLTAFAPGGQLDTSWTNRCIAGEVNSLAADGTTLFAGGAFDTTKDCDQSNQGSTPHIMAYSLDSGDAVTVDMAFNDTVKALNVVGETGMLVAGGSFTEANATSRGHAAAFNISDPAAVSLMDWDGLFNSDVNAIASDATNVYVGGTFTEAGSSGGRMGLATFTHSDTEVIDTAWDWNPQLSAGVNALAVKGPFLYVGGIFDNVDGDYAYGRAVAFDTTSLEDTNAPSDLFMASVNGTVNAVASAGNRIYFGGEFNDVDNVVSHKIFAIDPLDDLPAPVISSIDPDHGPLAGGAETTILGTHFREGVTVTIDGVTMDNIQYVSPTEIHADTPAGTAGDKDVVVTNNDDQSDTLVGGFTYVAAPEVTSVDPEEGTVDGGTSVEITGTGFLDGATVTIGDEAATDVLVDSDTTIFATTAAHDAGWVDVVVENTDGQSGTKMMGYEYKVYDNPAPELESIDPTHGPAAGGDTVTLTGTGFLGGATVKFADTPAEDVVVVSDTEVTVTAPAGTAGDVVSVQLTNTDEQSDMLADAYTYDDEESDPLEANSNNLTTSSGQAKCRVDGALSAVKKSVDAVGDSMKTTCSNTAFKFTALGSDKNPIGISDGKVLHGQKGRKLLVSGSGLKPNVDVKVYIFSSPTSLGTATTDSKGKFSLNATLPKALASGKHTVQANTYLKDGKVISMALGVVVDPAAKAKKTADVITFAEKSAKLTKAAKKKLDKLIKKLKKKKQLHIVVRGYVQPDKSRKNDKSLSKARANAVAYYFHTHGIKVKIYAKAKGRSKIKTKEGRRVTIKVSHQAIL